MFVFADFCEYAPDRYSRRIYILHIYIYGLDARRKLINLLHKTADQSTAKVYQIGIHGDLPHAYTCSLRFLVRVMGEGVLDCESRDHHAPFHFHFKRVHLRYLRCVCVWVGVCVCRDHHAPSHFHFERVHFGCLR